MKRDLKYWIPVVVVAITVGACGTGPDKSREDAVDVTHPDKTAPTAISFNNHYPNVETKCLSPGLRVVVGTHDSSTGNNILVVPDERCR